MTGSAIDGEDVVQDTIVKALRARAEGVEIGEPERWLLRIAHNASLDFLRRRARARREIDCTDVALRSDVGPDVVMASFQTFLQLTELQRCAVVLKDVLGHSIDEIAGVAGCSPAAAKSALQRGRQALRELATAPLATRLPLMSETDRQKITTFVRCFQSGDFDSIRVMLAVDARLDLVNRVSLEGREKLTVYFSRYAEETRWRFAKGAVEGRPAMLVYDQDASMPAHFVLIDWRADEISKIRDFLFAPYTLEGTDWIRLA